MKLWIIYLHFQYSYKYFLHRSTANQFIPREDTGPHTVFISNNNTAINTNPFGPLGFYTYVPVHYDYRCGTFFRMLKYSGPLFGICTL